jgi:phage baseplate assembly protein W
MTIYKGFSTYDRTKKFRITDFELAKQDLFNHFHIRKGEKLMNPNFGTIIWGILFEPFTEEIKSAIVKDIKTIAAYDPRISIDDVTVTQFEYGIQISLELAYIPTDQTQLISFTFDQNSKSVSMS